MKYRIKIQTNSMGEKTFIPQFSIIRRTFGKTDWYNYHECDRWQTCIRFSTYAETTQFLDVQIERDKKIETTQKAKRVTKTIYIKYP